MAHDIRSESCVCVCVTLENMSGSEEAVILHSSVSSFDRKRGSISEDRGIVSRDSIVETRS